MASITAPNSPQIRLVFRVVGVGVAGILLLSGLAFAALFVSRRNSARQMKPLTTHQEVLLSSDEIEHINAGNEVDQGNGNVEGRIDVSRDCSSPESDKIPESHRIIDDFNVGSQLVYDIHNKDIDTDATKHKSVQEELKIGSAADEESVPRQSAMVLNGSESENPVDSFDSSTAVDSQNSIAELKENPSFVEPRKVSNFDAEPLPVISEQQDEITDSSGNRSSGIVAHNENPEVIPEDLEESALNQSETPNFGAFYSSPGIPAPSAVSSAVQVLTGKVMVPVAVAQGQALAALQALKVIEPDVQPSDLCTHHEYAQWLVSASSALSRKTISKVYPATYIDNVTGHAFDDITPEDPDFSCTQGLAEAGLIESRLSRCCDRPLSTDEDYGPFYFSPESPSSHQDVVSWKIDLEKRQLPEADRNNLFASNMMIDGQMLCQLSGFIDTDKIHTDACPALVADVSAGEHGIIPHKPVTKAQTAIALAAGNAFDLVNEELACTVASQSVLVVQREKINAVERMAEEARCELERLRDDREKDRISLIKEQAVIESERNAFSWLRHEVEDQLQNLISDKVKIAYEKDKISKLQELAEVQNKEITQLQYELEVERKALSMARAWAEDEAKRVGEHASDLESASDSWERNESKVAVDDDFHELYEAAISKAGKSAQEEQQSAHEFGFTIKEGANRFAGDCRGVEKLTQKFKT
uniref:SLH domain-containing protein n=1 Tax=Glycine max TaxID=3847 RepID=K7N3R9_SOYBN